MSLHQEEEFTDNYTMVMVLAHSLYMYYYIAFHLDMYMNMLVLSLWHRTNQ